MVMVMLTTYHHFCTHNSYKPLPPLLLLLFPDGIWVKEKEAPKKMMVDLRLGLLLLMTEQQYYLLKLVPQLGN